MIKMIAIDMDGTLLNEEKNISHKNIEVLKKALDNGIVIVPASGRTFKGIPQELIDLKVPYAITSNGGIVMDVKNNEIVIKHEIEAGVAKKLIDIIDNFNSRVYCNIDGEHYFTLKSKATFKEKFFTVNEENFIDNLGNYIYENNLNPEKLGILFDDFKIKDEVLKLQEIFPELTIVETSPTSVEMTCAHVNKGSALKELARRLNIKQDEVMAIGDSNNDIEMLEYAGCAYAMANSTDMVKKVCNYMTDDNDNDGVAKAILAIL